MQCSGAPRSSLYSKIDFFLGTNSIPLAGRIWGRTVIYLNSFPFDPNPTLMRARCRQKYLKLLNKSSRVVVTAVYPFVTDQPISIRNLEWHNFTRIQIRQEFTLIMGINRNIFLFFHVSAGWTDVGSWTCIIGVQALADTRKTLLLCTSRCYRSHL